MFEDLFSAKKKLFFSAKETHFGKTFAQGGVSLAELKIDFRKIFIKASLSQNLENSANFYASGKYTKRELNLKILQLLKLDKKNDKFLKNE